MTTLRLVAIEARHNAALLLVPVILLGAWYLIDAQLWEPYLWSSTNELLRKSVVPLAGPAIAGAAAWMAGNDRRRAITDLLSTTPHPTLSRHLTRWFATAVWALLAYVVVAVYMFSRTTLHATWGGPEFWSVAIAEVALLAFAAWGYLAGYLSASRFTAPIVAVVAFSGQMFVANSMAAMGDGTQRSTWPTLLAVSNVTERSAPWQALLYAGLTFTAIAALWLAQRRDLVRGALLALAIVPVVGGVVMIWAGVPRWDYANNRLVDGWGNTIAAEEYTAPEPVCRGDDVVVCVHPQFQPWLDRAVLDAEHLVAPLRGLPGIASPVECRNIGFGTGRNDGTRVVVDGCVDQLVADESTLGQYGRIENEAQHAIGVWLLARIGGHTMCGMSVDPLDLGMGFPSESACDAGERFAVLTEAEQRDWLETHFADLRTGRLTLADLP